VKKGLLRIEAARPSLFGLEMHLAASLRAVREFEPAVAIIDPITDFVALGNPYEVRSMMTRLVDYLKSNGITALLTSLSSSRTDNPEEDLGVSSLIDTWIVVQLIEAAGERNRAISVLKSRGMVHSNQIREFVLGADGLKLIPAYRGPGGFLSGSARKAQELADRTVQRTTGNGS
jgi:circadian clock protein KaiC